jgi:hypothetical protein
MLKHQIFSFLLSGLVNGAEKRGVDCFLRRYFQNRDRLVIAVDVKPLCHFKNE